MSKEKQQIKKTSSDGFRMSFAFCFYKLSDRVYSFCKAGNFSCTSVFVVNTFASSLVDLRDCYAECFFCSSSVFVSNSCLNFLHASFHFRLIALFLAVLVSATKILFFADLMLAMTYTSNSGKFISCSSSEPDTERSDEAYSFILCQ